MEQDFIGAAIARKVAAEGLVVHVGRRNGDKLQPLLKRIAGAGGRAHGRTLDAHIAGDVTAILAETKAQAPMALTIFDVGANGYSISVERTVNVNLQN